MTTSVATPPKCDARTTKVGADAWGTRGIPCQTTRGLRSYIDRHGIRRFYCAVADHQRNVERAFGR